eukprot:scaffold73243_cov31-Tisochrysis_lutea.AAC.1
MHLRVTRQRAPQLGAAQFVKVKALRGGGEAAEAWLPVVALSQPKVVEARRSQLVALAAWVVQMAGQASSRDSRASALAGRDRLASCRARARALGACCAPGGGIPAHSAPPVVAGRRSRMPTATCGARATALLPRTFAGVDEQRASGARLSVLDSLLSVCIPSLFPSRSLLSSSLPPSPSLSPLPPSESELSSCRSLILVLGDRASSATDNGVPPPRRGTGVWLRMLANKIFCKTTISKVVPLPTDHSNFYNIRH